MTQDTKHASRRAVLPAAALAALLLAGCSSGNIGESWQCPLAKGGSCDSVAAADPAVPDPAAGPSVLAEPLWHVRNGDRARLSPDTAAACASDCGAGFDPFAWLARLFGAETDEGEGRPAGGSARASAAPPAEAAPTLLPAPGSREPVPASEPGRQAPGPAEDGPQADDLRTGEVVARIWIAPFVDADGVYREASYIRVVLEPAGWRLP